MHAEIRHKQSSQGVFCKTRLPLVSSLSILIPLTVERLPRDRRPTSSHLYVRHHPCPKQRYSRLKKKLHFGSPRTWLLTETVASCTIISFLDARLNKQFAKKKEKVCMIALLFVQVVVVSCAPPSSCFSETRTNQPLPKNDSIHDRITTRTVVSYARLLSFFHQRQGLASHLQKKQKNTHNRVRNTTPTDKCHRMHHF